MTSLASAPAANTATLVDVLRAHARTRPDHLALVFLADGETEERRLTFGELDGVARRIAAVLRRDGLAGERALLLLPSGLDYVTAFFGCLYAGVAAVCAYPPPAGRSQRMLPRLRAIVSDSRPRVAFTTQQTSDEIAAFLAGEPGLAGLRWLAADGPEVAAGLDPAGPDPAWEEPGSDPGDLAFLMYTSGSTGDPKGVMVGHGNVMHNLSAFRGFDQRPLSAGVSWLPLFHDLGLVFGVLHPLFRGVPAILMPPEAFVRRPVRWLQAISRFRASATFSPNVGFELCLQRIDPAERAALDLSCCNMALNGAEPVRWQTLERFAATFAACGFRREALYPAFGLSEATADVSGNPDFRPPLVRTLCAAELERHRLVDAAPGEQGAQPIVGCGAVLAGQRVAIVDPETRLPCPPDRVGEVWVHGPSVGQGYWGRLQETEQTFQACLADSGDGPFLRTGDLGFLFRGELFITGRIKDLIILHGVNHYPQDIELAVSQAHPALRPAGAAAFSVEADDEERLVVVQEVGPLPADNPAEALDEVFGAIRHNLTEEHDLHAWAIVLLRPGALPKTSSGKVQRRGCRAAFLAGELDAVAQWRAAPDRSPAAALPPPTGPEGVEARLVAAVARLGGLDPSTVDPAQPLGRYGLDSLKVAELRGQLERGLGRPVPMRLLAERLSLGQLAQRLADQVGTAER